MHSQKDLNTTARPVAWILCGISGSGKTSYSRSEKFKECVRLSVDEFMWGSHGEAMLSFPSDTLRQLTAEAEDSILSEMQRELAAGNDVVLDSCMCKRFKRDRFAKAAREAGADAKIVFLKADRETLLRRIKIRSDRPVNADSLPVSEEQLLAYLKGFEAPGDEEQPIIIMQQ